MTFVEVLSFSVVSGKVEIGFSCPNETIRTGNILNAGEVTVLVEPDRCRITLTETVSVEII